VRLEGLGQLKTSTDLIGNRTHHLLGCSRVPQPTMLPSALFRPLRQFNPFHRFTTYFSKIHLCLGLPSNLCLVFLPLKFHVIFCLHFSFYSVAFMLRHTFLHSRSLTFIFIILNGLLMRFKCLTFNQNTLQLD
jgi:hypothetical protein